MKGITLLEKYPVSAELIKAWFLEKMIESFKELPHPKEELPAPKANDSLTIVPAW